MSACAKSKASKPQLLWESGVVAAGRDQVTKGDDTTALPMARWGWSWGSCTPTVGPLSLSPEELFHQEIFVFILLPHPEIQSQKESTEPSGVKQLLCVTISIKAWRKMQHYFVLL